MIDLGTVRPGSTIRIPFSSFDKDDGSSITMTNYAAADILVYKDGSTTERASASGFTATTDFDSKTGKHLAVIDLSDDTTADFFKAGSEYLVAIDAVTVDAVTTGGWIARFRIGYPNAYFDTSIATLASQTSFTLTAGPAEDDALNGMVLLVHDKASAVQLTRVVVEDYTGASKTVTLRAVPATTFTIAAGDNVSGIGFDKVDVTHFGGTAATTSGGRPEVNTTHLAGTAYASADLSTTMKASINTEADTALSDYGPLKPTTAGRTLDVSAGGEAGVDWANVGSPTTVVGLSGTTIKTATDVETDTADIQARIPAALGANGNIKADVRDFGGTAATSSGGRPEVNATHVGGTIQTTGQDVVANVTTLLGRITSTLFSGITSLAQWLGLIAGKQTGNSTARTELRATGAGSGTYDETTDSQEALRDRGDAAWTTATGFSTLDAAGVRTAVGLASANLDTQLAAIAAYIDTEVAAILAAVDTEVAAIKAKTDNLPAAPAAVGDIPTANANADALLDRTSGVETSITVRQALRGILSSALAKLSGAATTTVTIRDANDTKNRITATVDSDGNRSAVTLDLT